MVQSERAIVWRKSLSVAGATALYGVSFGALAIASGLTIGQTMVLSLLMFSGGSQFALLGVLSAGGSAIAAIVTAGVLGVRNTLYGISLNAQIPPSKRLFLPAAHVTIDESTAVALSARAPQWQRLGFWVTGIGVFIGWNATTLIGALVGDLLGDVRAYGLDAAAAAAFIGLLWPRLKNRQTAAAACASAVLAVVLIPALPAGLPILLAVVVAVVLGATNWLGASMRKTEVTP